MLDNKRAAQLIAALTSRPLATCRPGHPEGPQFLESADRHGVGPLLSALSNAGDIQWAEGVLSRLREMYVACAARNMALLHEAGIILKSFETAGVPVIPLKGAFLAEAVYGDIALRPMADLDLLVKSADLPSAIETLRRLGYVSDQPFDPVAQQAGFQDMPPMRKPGGAMVELHWTLVTPLCGARIDEPELAGIWERSVPASVAGVPSRALSPEDLLLHLCTHASVHHRFADVGLKSFVDMAEVARHYEGQLDWAVLAGRANRWGVANGVRMALMLAEEWTDLRVPAEAWTRLDGGAPDEQTLDWARHKVLEGRPAPLVSLFARLESDGGVTGKLAALRTAAFPSREVMARLYGVPSGSWRIVAYYPYRLWDLWTHYRGALWRLVRRDRAFVDEASREARLREYLGWR
jgi:Uncharacterised nucleotidyltransferase